MMDISIDGVKLGDLGIRVKEDSSYLGLPATRDQVISVPGRHGAYPMGSWLEPRRINLSCRISNKKTTREIAETIRTLGTILLDQYGRPKEVKLVMGHEPEKYYKVKYVGAIPVDKQAHTGDFDLPLVAYDPFAYFLYSANEITWDKDIPIMSDVYWGTGINQFKINENQTLEIYNSGNIVIRPTFIITGSTTSLTLAMNGKSFSLPSFSNVTYEINGENYTVFKNGVNNFSDKIGKDWVELLPGINQLTVTGTGLNIHLTVDYRFKYL